MMQAISATKLSARFQTQLYAQVEADNRLLEEELKIKKDLWSYSKNKIAFVPDDLTFGCQEGVDIYKVTMPPLQSFIAIRSP